MRRGAGWLAAVLVSTAMCADAQDARLLVMDLPYARVWDAAVRALAAYPIARAVDGTVETGRWERPPGAEEPGLAPGLAMVAEQVTVRVEAVADRVTRVSVTVRAEGLRDGAWVPLPDTEARARAILARVREAASQPP